MGDLISQVVQLTQIRLAQRLSFSEEMQSMVLEVRVNSLSPNRLPAHFPHRGKGYKPSICQVPIGLSINGKFHSI